MHGPTVKSLSRMKSTSAPAASAPARALRKSVSLLPLRLGLVEIPSTFILRPPNPFSIFWYHCLAARLIKHRSYALPDRFAVQRCPKVDIVAPAELPDVSGLCVEYKCARIAAGRD